MTENRDITGCPAGDSTTQGGGKHQNINTLHNPIKQREYMKKVLGDKLIAPGKWHTDHDGNGIPVKAVYDRSYREVFGYESEEEYEDAQKKWTNRIHPDDAERVESHFHDVISKHPEGLDYDIEYRIMTKWGYRWFHDYGHCTRREDGSLQHCDGVIFDIQEVKEYELQLAHDKLRKEILDYIVSHEDDDPIELLGKFAEKIRSILDCDQVIYRDLEDTRIMVNSSGIEKKWSVPESYCRQCQHFNAHHPMYKDGYTEMDNCQEGWQGIPVYEKCPIKSSLTRIVYCNGQVAGYLAVHYVQKYHHFTDIERKTSEEFVNDFSLVLSKYETKKRLQEIQEKKEHTAQAIAENYARVLTLEDNLESLYDVEMESGRYSEYVKGEFYRQNVTDKLSRKGDFFADIKGNIDTVVFSEDREELKAFLEKKRLRKALSETERIEHYYRLSVGGTQKWFKIRVVYQNEDKKVIIIGCFDAQEEMTRKEIEEQRRQVLISQMAGNDGVFIVDCVHDTRKTLHDARRGISGSFEQEGYSEFIIKHINSYTVESDRGIMLQMADPGYMLDRVKREGEYSVRFRDILSGRPQFIEMKVVKLSDTEVLQTFTSKDREVVSSLISTSIEQDYFALYSVDLDFGLVQIVKDSPYFPQGGVGTVDDYSASFKRFASHFDGEPREFFERISDAGYLKRRFVEESKSTFTYKASTGQWVNVTGLVLSRHEDGEPSLFAIGFSFSDSLESKVKDAQEEAKNANLRNDILHSIIHSGKWSFFLNADDEITRAEYSDEVKRLVNSEFSEEGHSWLDIVHPGDKEAARTAFNAAIADHSCNTPYDVVYRMHDRNGVYRWFHSAGRVIRDKNGNGEFFGVHIDVTDTVEEQQRRAAAQIAKSMNIFFTLSSEYDPIIVVEPETGEYDWYMGMADDVAANTSMTTHGENLYKNIGIDSASIIHEDDREQFRAFYTRENMMEIARTGVTQETENRWFIQTEGRYKWKYNKAVRMVDEAGKVLVVVGVMDTTEAKEKAAKLSRDKEIAHKQLEAALKKAEVASKAKSSFLFNMSHDIRTPMNAITGFTKMAKKYANDPVKVTDYLDKIDISGQQLLMLINQVLEMSRIESGKVEFEEHPVNIKERFDTMTAILTDQASSRGLKFSSSLEGIEHFNIFADDTRMSQITLNIVGNAMKYTPEGGRIEFNIREIPARKEGRASFVFTVRDTGIGMSEGFLKNIFEPFAREKTSTVSKIQGTGLGMSIVKSLVDLAGGDIDVKSKPGKGTEFEVTMDFRINGDAKDSGAGLTETRNLSFSFRGKRALLVEDNEMNREIAKFLLEDKGVATEVAEDGDIAVEIIEKIVEDGDLSHFDFILMDVQMPRMNGYEATGKIRKILEPLGVHIPIIALSANAFEEDRQKSVEAGMDDHVAKPIDVARLWETLARFL